jgi:hypothetical protein
MRVKFRLRIKSHEEWCIFGAEKILTILCGANSPEVTKDPCEVLLGFETTGHCHVQYSRFGST